MIGKKKWGFEQRKVCQGQVSCGRTFIARNWNVVRCPACQKQYRKCWRPAFERVELPVEIKRRVTILDERGREHDAQAYMLKLMIGRA